MVIVAGRSTQPLDVIAYRQRASNERRMGRGNRHPSIFNCVTVCFRGMVSGLWRGVLIHQTGLPRRAFSVGSRRGINRNAVSRRRGAQFSGVCGGHSHLPGASIPGRCITNASGMASKGTAMTSNNSFEADREA